MPSPEWWLTHLTEQMDLRRHRLGLLRRYLDGDAPLPEGAEGCRKAYQQFQRKSRLNMGELIVDAVGERMRVGNFRVGTSSEDDDEVRRIWTANRLQVWSGDVHRDMLGLSAGYVCVQPGEGRESGVEILHERPEQVIVEHDPQRPDKRRAGAKVFRDDIEGADFAYVHIPGWMARFWRPTPIVDGVRRPILTYRGGWIMDIEPQETNLSSVPFVPFVNRGGMGEFESHTDLLDRINWSILQRLVIIAMQAYRQRATKGDLPETDEAGNQIDYGQIFKPGPGSLWQLPDGVELWESQQTEIGGLLEASKEDRRDLAAVTRTPMSTLMPDGANQSAEGAAFAREGLIFKCEDRIARAQASWVEAMRLALEIERGSVDRVPDLDVLFAPPERRSLAERADALTKVREDIPWRTRMTDIMGYDGPTVDRMAAERAEDAMLGAALLGQGQQPPASATGRQSAAPVPAQDPAVAVEVEVA